MLKGISCAIRVMVRIHCESCLIDCVGSMLRYGEKGAIVAKQRSFSLCLFLALPQPLCIFRGACLLSRWRVSDGANLLVDMSRS